MFYRKDFEKIFKLMLSFSLAVLMLIVTNLRNGTFSALTVESFLQGALTNWTAGFFMAYVMPLPSLGNAVAGKCRLTPNTLPFTLVSTFVSAAIMCYPLALIGLFYNMGFNPALPVIWITSSTIQLGIGYIFLLFALPTCGTIAGKLCTKSNPPMPGASQ